MVTIRVINSDGEWVIEGMAHILRLFEKDEDTGMYWALVRFEGGHEGFRRIGA